MFTIVESRTTISCATPSRARTAQRLGSAAGEWGAAMTYEGTKRRPPPLRPGVIVFARPRETGRGRLGSAPMVHGDGTSALVGREEELAALEGLLERGRERGDALVLHGQPGIGKSALAAATV